MNKHEQAIFNAYGFDVSVWTDNLPLVLDNKQIGNLVIKSELLGTALQNTSIDGPIRLFFQLMKTLEDLLWQYDGEELFLDDVDEALLYFAHRYGALDGEWLSFHVFLVKDYGWLVWAKDVKNNQEINAILASVPESVRERSFFEISL